jgi:SOUL heme-binding protein
MPDARTGKKPFAARRNFGLEEGVVFMMKRVFAVLAFAVALSGGVAVAVEEPKFHVSVHEGAFEVRDYPALVAAEVEVGGTREEASNAGFRLLAGYIFGGNTRRESIAMTAPVVQAPAASQKIPMTAPVIQTGNAGAWTVRFIMPEGSTLQSLPTPNNPQVKLITLPPQRFAVVRFSGLAGQADVVQRTETLRAFIGRRGLTAAGPPSLARYNPPWTLWFMRRNEVMIPLAS